MTATLDDGTAVVVRAIGPDDEELLSAAFARLSDDSRYRRFLGPKDALSDAELQYLTVVDHHDHEALAAFAEDSGEPLGITRVVRLEDDPVVRDAECDGVAWRSLGAHRIRGVTEPVPLHELVVEA